MVAVTAAMVGTASAQLQGSLTSSALFETLGRQPMTLVRELAKVFPQHGEMLNDIAQSITTDPHMSTECVGCQVRGYE